MVAVRLETSKKFCWILEHRILCVKKCWQPGSFKAVQEDFQANFEMDKSPAKSLIQRWINNFDAHRTVGDLHTASRDRETHSGRPRKHSACVIGAVHDSVVQSPKTLLTEMLPVIQFEQVYASESAPRWLEQLPLWVKDVPETHSSWPDQKGSHGSQTAGENGRNPDFSDFFCGHLNLAPQTFTSGAIWSPRCMPTSLGQFLSWK